MAPNDILSSFVNKSDNRRPQMKRIKVRHEQGDEFDVLADRVEAYEHRHHPIGPGNGLRALKHLMQANGLTPSDLPEISIFLLFVVRC
jgi:hypothetical protein